MPPSPAAFRDLLLGLDSGELAAFVAAVYDARGWTVDHDGDSDTLRVRADGEADWRRLVVGTDADRPPVRADRVVVSALAADTDIDADRPLDAAALLELAWYAVDDTDRTRLFRTFFDRDPAEFETATDADDGPNTRPVTEQSVGSTSTAADAGATSDTAAASHPSDPRDDDDGDADAAAPTDSPPLAHRLAVVVAILLVVGGVIVAVGPTLGPSGDEAPADAAAGGNATDATTSPDTADGAALDSTDREAVGATNTGTGAATVEGPLPPGVAASGIENASALVDAHEAALDGRSYRLSVVAREFVGGTPTAVARERTVVEGPTRYRSDVSVIGPFRQEPRAIGTVSTYANGTTRFVRLTGATDADGTVRFTERGTESETAGGPGWRSVAATDSDPFANRTATHLRGVLDVDDAAVVGSFERDGTTYVWIDLRRRPPGGTDAIDSILVDEHGLVHEMRHEYAYLPPESSTVRTVVTVRIEPANVTATPPPWL